MADTFLMLCSAAGWLFSGHGRQSHRVHPAVHSSDTDTDAIVTLQDVGNLVSSDALNVVSIDLKDGLSDTLVLLDSGSGLRVEVLVISAVVYVKHPAGRLNAVLEAELMDCV